MTIVIKTGVLSFPPTLNVIYNVTVILLYYCPACVSVGLHCNVWFSFCESGRSGWSGPAHIGRCGCAWNCRMDKRWTVKVISMRWCSCHIMSYIYTFFLSDNSKENGRVMLDQKSVRNTGTDSCLPNEMSPCQTSAPLQHCQGARPASY